MESIKKLRRKRPQGKRGGKKPRYTTEFKVHTVKLYLEEEYSSRLLCSEPGIGVSTLSNWVKRYRLSGVAGLEGRSSGSRRSRTPAPIKDRIVDLKRENPRFGVKRISQFLRRVLHLPASPETVRKTRFQKELQKDGIHHLRSSPHHPMTLGKVERFWSSLFQEFLGRAQFNSFDDARERIGVWVKYYNHKRPHQGIGGLCPADRYFEIQEEMRQTMEKGMADNLRELALRGKPRKPFYMVGRMDGQSVVLRAEKGRLRLSVDDDRDQKREEMIYNLTEKDDTYGKENHQENAETGTDPEETPVSDVRRIGTEPGSTVGVDGTPEAGTGLPGVVHPGSSTEPLAETGAGGDASGVGAPGESGEGSGSLSPVTNVTGAETTLPGGTAGEESKPGKSSEPSPGGPEDRFREVIPEKRYNERQREESPETGSQVRSGTITVAEGARRLGVSRKTYYQWDHRGLDGLISALEDQESGRPPQSADPEKEAMTRRIQALETELETAQQIAAVRKAQLEYEKQQRVLDRKRPGEKRAKKKRK